MRSTPRSWMDSAPSSIGAERCGSPNKVMVVRFDQMATRFAVVAWDRALLLDAWDTTAATTFAQQWTDSPAAPERGGCAAPNG